ncbi:MAG TPA: type IV secretion system DNA-binding domain-containing protein [Acidobacteriota bacterium]|nr:type IV secretion system DNA-binding domain-containing protein [Acidobacteriota bacterium]
MAEVSVVLPQSASVSVEAAEHLLTTLPRSERPLAFEVIGGPARIEIQFACAECVRPTLRHHLAAAFPEAAVVDADGTLERTWTTSPGADALVAEYGMAEEFMVPLRAYRSLRVDPLAGIAAALSDLREGEVGVLQVLLQPVRHPWADSIRRAVLDEQGSPFFLDAPEVTALAKEKVSRPLFAVVIRFAAKSPVQGRATTIARGLGWALNALANPPANQLIPLSNAEYPDDDHEQDLLDRRTRRSGMILGSAELASLVHPPSSSVRIGKLVRQVRRTSAAPGITVEQPYTLGVNEHAGRTVEVGLSEEQRSRHLYVVGASGTGKSTLLLNGILQDLTAGAGLAVLDPHGDLVDEILRRCPPDRAGDVVLLDPADAEHPIGFNVLTAHSELERTLLSSDLVSVFRRLSTSWGDQMTSVLGNAIQAFLESERGGTLVDLRRFLVEGAFRREYLKGVKDTEVVYYWEREFPLLSGKPQAPLLTRLDTFLRPKPIRYMVAQKESRLDLRKLMDTGGVLLCRLSQGAIGEENAYLLGTLLVSKLHQIAISRQELAASERRPFYLYIDEFQNFVTPSMEAILSGARKYRLGLILAHQELRQVGSRSPEVLASVLANPYARVCFRVGDDDARKLADGFAHFTAQDLQSLGIGEAIARVERAEYDFNLRTELLPGVEAGTGEGLRLRIVAQTRERYARPRAEVEALLRGLEPESPNAERDGDPMPSVSRRGVPQRTAPAPQSDRVGSLAPVEPPTRGRGGSQHKYLQELIRRWAEAHGWRADIEERILDGLGSVDVALRKGDRSVACEIGVSTTPEHELQNVQKCLAAGFEQVVVVTSERRTLNHIKALVAAALSEEQAGKVACLMPEELFDFLDGIEAASRSTEQTVRGYRIKVRLGATSPEERANRHGAVATVIARTLKGMVRGKNK